MRTNSKQAIKNIRQYIINNANFDGYTQFENTDKSNFEQVATAIYKIFFDEVGEHYTKIGYTTKQAFEHWAQGLPSALNTCYYLGQGALDDLAAIIEQDASEKAKYTAEQAEKTLTYLIYRELKKAARV